MKKTSCGTPEMNFGGKWEGVFSSRVLSGTYRYPGKRDICWAVVPGGSAKYEGKKVPLDRKSSFPHPKRKHEDAIKKFS